MLGLCVFGDLIPHIHFLSRGWMQHSDWSNVFVFLVASSHIFDNCHYSRLHSKSAKVCCVCSKIGTFCRCLTTIHQLGMLELSSVFSKECAGLLFQPKTLAHVVEQRPDLDLSCHSNRKGCLVPHLSLRYVSFHEGIVLFRNLDVWEASSFSFLLPVGDGGDSPVYLNL